MGRPVRSNAASRAPLSKERVLRAAIELADAGGIESVSMRKLAQALGVEAMSLYYYVANKDDILDGIVDIVVGDMATPPAGIAWKAALRASAISAHGILMRHPWACSLMMLPARVRPARIHYMEALLGCLRGAGFSPWVTLHAYHALDSHILGSTLWEIGYTSGAQSMGDLATSFLEELGLDEHPFLAEHISQHLEGASHPDRSDFEFGLDLLLDGLERTLAAGGSGAG